jgi:hypothetical protein
MDSFFEELGSEQSTDSVQVLFDEIDIDKVGKLQRADLKLFLRERADSMNLHLADDVIDLAVEALLQDKEYLTRDQFTEMFQNHPDLYCCFDTKSSLQMRKLKVSMSGLTRAEQDESKRENVEVWKRLKTTKQPIRWYAWLAVFVAGTLAAFLTAAIMWANEEEAIAVFGNCVIFARACAQALNLTGALVLIPVSYKAMAMLRTSQTMNRLFYPLENEQQFHKIIGLVFLGFAATVSIRSDYRAHFQRLFSSRFSSPSIFCPTYAITFVLLMPTWTTFMLSLATP